MSNRYSFKHGNLATPNTSAVVFVNPEILPIFDTKIYVELPSWYQRILGQVMCHPIMGKERCNHWMSLKDQICRLDEGWIGILAFSKISNTHSSRFRIAGLVRQSGLGIEILEWNFSDWHANISKKKDISKYFYIWS